MRLVLRVFDSLFPGQPWANIRKEVQSLGAHHRYFSRNPGK